MDVPDDASLPTSRLPDYPNPLHAYLDANPFLKASVYVGAALSLAVMLQNWLQPAASSRQSSNSDAVGTGKQRRRDPACALAIVPDGSGERSDREWKRALPPELYASLRAAETDPPNLVSDEGGIDDIIDEGIFRCAGCSSALYTSDMRFEAGCGWPCFFTCIRDAVRERQDRDRVRMELVCNVCSSHLGHIFRGEGWALPAPAERHCVNGRSLIFDPANLSDGEYAVETGEDDDVDEADDDDAYEWGEDDEGDESGSAVVDEDIGISDPDELKDR